jgi:hypothetical protein
MVSKMEVASASGMGVDYPRLALRTRVRRQDRSACHAPGCRHRAMPGRKFCKLCQTRLDRVRLELAAGGAARRKPNLRRAPPVRKVA